MYYSLLLINNNIDLKQMETIQTVDLNAVAQSTPPPKRRGRPKGSGKKKTADAIDLDAEEKEMKQLREQLLQYADHNEDVVTKTVNDKLARLVNNMSIDELRARVRQGKKINSSRLDSVVGENLIWLANQSVGNLLDCVEELNESTEHDKLLQETVTSYFSLNVLDYVPMEIKMSGLYAAHVLKATYEAQKRATPVKQNKTNLPKPLPEMPVKKQESPITITPVAPPSSPVDTGVGINPPTPEPIKLNKRDIEASIGPMKEVRDRLIKFQADLSGFEM
jgi:hypothetical protein